MQPTENLYKRDELRSRFLFSQSFHIYKEQNDREKMKRMHTHTHIESEKERWDGQLLWQKMKFLSWYIAENFVHNEYAIMNGDGE